MICLKCGKTIRDGAKFCPACGTPVENNGENTDNRTKKPAVVKVKVTNSKKSDAFNGKELNASMAKEPIRDNSEKSVNNETSNIDKETTVTKSSALGAVTNFVNTAVKENVGKITDSLSENTEPKEGKENSFNPKVFGTVTLDGVIDPRYTPISMWGYFGYEILFSIPIIGIIFLIVYSFGATTNLNVRNFARSYFCLLIIVFVVAALFGLIAGGGLLLFG